MPFPVRYTYVYDITGYYDIWAMKNNVWAKVMTYPASVYQSGYSTAGERSFPVEVHDSFQLGSGVQASGVSFNSTSSGTGSVTYFNRMFWQALASSGTSRSATPGGELTTITVRPR